MMSFVVTKQSRRTPTMSSQAISFKVGVVLRRSDRNAVTMITEGKAEKAETTETIEKTEKAETVCSCEEGRIHEHTEHINNEQNRVNNNQ